MNIIQKIFGTHSQNELKRMRKESGYDNLKVVATGGLGKMIYENTDCIDVYDPDLTLHGLRLIMDKQK